MANNQSADKKKSAAEKAAAEKAAAEKAAAEKKAAEKAAAEKAAAEKKAAEAERRVDEAAEKEDSGIILAKKGEHLMIVVNSIHTGDAVLNRGDVHPFSAKEAESLYESGAAYYDGSDEGKHFLRNLEIEQRQLRKAFKGSQDEPSRDSNIVFEKKGVPLTGKEG